MHHDVASLLLVSHSSSPGTSSLDTLKTVIDIIASLITSAAIVVGGVWAYFKFAQGRTFRPRIEVDLSGQWRNVGESKLLHARIRVKNIGLSKITLIQKGSGLRASLMAESQPSPPARSSWVKGKVYVVLKKHDWVEPGETVSDEILLTLGASNPEPTLLEARLVWQKRKGNIVVNAKRIIPADAVMSDIKEGA